jgi:hypothetical protein
MIQAGLHLPTLLPLHITDQHVWVFSTDIPFSNLFPDVSLSPFYVSVDICTSKLHSSAENHPGVHHAMALVYSQHATSVVDFDEL